MSRDPGFVREPIEELNGIPVFSATSPYVQNYERIAEDHIESEARTGHNPFIPEYLWRESEESTVDLIRRYAHPGDMVLDVGVGLGRLLQDLPELHRFGMDISLPYLERARAKGISVSFALVEDMPYHAESFDIVLATDILEHVLDLNVAVRQMITVLRPGGYLIVRSPFREDLWPYLDPSYPYRFVHLRTFDEASLRLLFERGFDCTVEEVVTAGHMLTGQYLDLPVPLLVRRAISRLIVRPLAGARPGFLRRLRTLYRPIEINVVVRRP